VIGCPADLSIYILKRIRVQADRLRAVEPDLAHFKVESFDVRQVPLRTWEECLRQHSQGGAGQVPDDGNDD
jgi:hypothetical protein